MLGPGRILPLQLSAGWLVETKNSKYLTATITLRGFQMNWADAIFLLIVFVVLGVMFFRDLRYTLRKRASENWPTVEAVVETGDIGPRAISSLPRLLYRVYFTYTYRVSNVKCTGRFCLLAGSKKTAETLKQALTGKSTVVRYDVRDPSISLLSDRQMMGKRVMQGPSWTYN
jgi:hypothetical protein